jgi:hypothetical protein
MFSVDNVLGKIKKLYSNEDNDLGILYITLS